MIKTVTESTVSTGMALELTENACARAALAYQAPGLMAYRQACRAGTKARARVERDVTRFCIDVLHAWRDRAPEA